VKKTKRVKVKNICILIILMPIVFISCATTNNKYDDLYFSKCKVGIFTYCYFPGTPGLGDDLSFEKYVSPIIKNTIQIILNKNTDEVIDLNVLVDRKKIIEPLSIDKNYINYDKLISLIPQVNIDYFIIVQIGYRPWKIKLSDGHEVYRLNTYKTNIVDAKTMKIKESIELPDQDYYVFEKEIDQYNISKCADVEKYKAFIAGPLVKVFSWIGFYRYFDYVTE